MDQWEFPSNRRHFLLLPTCLSETVTDAKCDRSLVYTYQIQKLYQCLKCVCPPIIVNSIKQFYNKIYIDQAAVSFSFNNRKKNMYWRFLDMLTAISDSDLDYCALKSRQILVVLGLTPTLLLIYPSINTYAYATLSKT